MVEPTQRQVDLDLDTSMKMFERVQVGEVAAIEPRPPKRILLALDGSTQDTTSTAIAKALVKRFSAEVVVLAACDQSQDVARRSIERLAAGSIVQSRGAEDSFQQILGTIESNHCDLVIVPCPFGRDFDQIGPDSAGTVVDVMLARSSVPLLVVREPCEVAGVPFANTALRLAGENKAEEAAAAWAAAMVAPQGRLALVLVLEGGFYEQVSALLESMDLPEPTLDALAAGVQKAHVRLHRALQKTASEQGFDYGLRVQREDPTSHLAEETGQTLSLVVVALERPDQISEGYARDCIRYSRHPVLVVPRAC